MDNTENKNAAEEAKTIEPNLDLLRGAIADCEEKIKNLGDLGKNIDETLQSQHSELVGIAEETQNFNEELEKINASYISLKNSFSQLSAETEKIVEITNDKTNKLSTLAEGIVDKINTELDRITLEATRIGADFSQADSQIQTLNDSIESISSKIQSINEEISQVNSALTTAEEKINLELKRANEEFKAKELEFEKNFQAWLEQKASALVTKFDPIETNIAQLVDFLEKKKKEAIDIVGIIADTGLVGKYKSEADTEKKSATFWRRTGFLLMSLPIALVMYALHEFASNFDFKIAIFRFISGIALSLPSIVALREANKHFANSKACRNKELELVSLNPYLDKLPENQKNEIKKQLASKYFGQNNESSKEATQEFGLQIQISEKELKGILKKAITPAIPDAK